jgi:hypothetical protein
MAHLSSRLPAVVIGVLIALLSCRTMLISQRRRRGTIPATGQVVGYQKVASMGGPMLPSATGQGLSTTGFGPDYKPVIEFTTPEGRVVQFQSQLQMNGNAMAMFGRRYRIGNQIAIRYRPDDPQQAIVDTPAVWAIGVIVLLAGLGTVAGSLLAP